MIALNVKFETDELMDAPTFTNEEKVLAERLQKDISFKKLGFIYKVHYPVIEKNIFAHCFQKQAIY